MFEIVAVTDRLRCPFDFLTHIEKIASAGVTALILREKDLSPEAYEALAREVSKRCAASGTRFVMHGFLQAARNLDCRFLHLPWGAFVENHPGPHPSPGLNGQAFSFGVSVHSAEDARLAVEQGAAWLMAGHVFPTQCKAGLAARGLDFLAEVRRVSPVPVYGIGGVTEENIAEVSKTGASGVCLMSSLMESPDPAALMEKLRRALNPQHGSISLP